MRRNAWWILAAATVVLAGCGSGDTAKNDTTTGGATTGGATADKGKPLTIAVIPKGSTHEFWKSVHAGADDAAKELGNVTIDWKGPMKEDDKASQIDTVGSFVVKGESGIVLAPLDDKALLPAVNEATKSNIPVLIIDSALSGGETVSFVATDNEKGGHMAGAEMARLLGGKGKVVVLPYAVGSASTIAREKGFLDEMAKNPGITVVSSNQYGGPTVETAQKTSENLLATHKKGAGLDIDGIFASNESNSFGMLRVLQDSAWTGKVKFVGFDASAKLLEALGKGEIDGLIVQNPHNMGYLGVKTLVAKIRGEKVEARIDTGATLVTKANMNTDENKKLLTPPKE